ncbi:MAG: hypothetical protein M1827_007086 [Pycnora praestabilis]|nr:MAG: hypothetical protein M1827_007086 [Pycnora praestabilis]
MSDESSMRSIEKPEAFGESSDNANLPYQTLTAGADMSEFTKEYPSGCIRKQVTTPEGREKTYLLVTFLDSDPKNPKNWSKFRKWWVTMMVGGVCFAAAFSSAIVTPGVYVVADALETSTEISLLQVTVFVVGFGIGPLVFSPFSELFGRSIIYNVTLGFAVIFVIPCAVAKNIQTLLVCRAIDGIGFSAPITIVGGTLADMWRKEERAVPMAVFSAAPFLGPVMGPLVGGFVLDNLGWRWEYWLQLIVTGFLWIMMVVTVPETYAPKLLLKRAQQLRKETGDISYVTEQEIDQRPLPETMRIFLFRPFQLLFGELIVILFSLYTMVLYGLLYMFFVAYPVIFSEGKGYSASIAGLMFIPIAVGVLVGTISSPLVNTHYLTLVRKHNGSPPPEVRLIPMMWACWSIPIGVFINAWTSYPRLSWVGPCLAGLPVGFGFVFLYNAINNYLVDSYQHMAASALAAKTLVRSVWGAMTVLFTIQMYHRLGYQWAGSLIGFISLACCAIPYIFYYKGATIRRRSKYAFSETPPQH